MLEMGSGVRSGVWCQRRDLVSEVDLVSVSEMGSKGGSGVRDESGVRGDI